MKKNKMMRIASVLLVAVLLSTCAISGTFAKYTSTIAGTDTARVAKWDFKVGGTTANSSAEFTFDLFKTIKDTDDSAEDDIAPTDGTVIAPGTQGSFDIVLNNASEVTATYAIAFAVTNANNIPVEFKVGSGEWKSTLDNVAATELAIGGDATVTVSWRWAYGDGSTDAADTTLGLAGTATLGVTATVTATQVD